MVYSQWIKSIGAALNKIMREYIMDKTAVVLELILPVLATLALGYFSKQKKLIGSSVIDGIKTLVMSFMLPAVLFGAFYKTTFGTERLLITVTMFLTCAIGLAIGLLILRLMPKGEPLLPFITSSFEAGMIGYGLYAMLFSPAETHYFASIDLGQGFFVFSVYMTLLNKRKGLTTKDALKSMFKSPSFLAIISGLFLSITGLGGMFADSVLGTPVESMLSYIGAPTGMLMIFVVGYQISIEPARIKSAFLATFIRTIIMAVLCFVTINFLSIFITMEKPLFWATILMFSLPAPFVLPIFSGDKKEEGFIATTLSISTLVSIGFFIIISILQ